jgi:DNA-binding IclR family transcriptional regulator
VVASKGAASIGEIISTSGIPRPTVSRTVAGLENDGYLRRTTGRGRYSIGARLVEVASDVLRSTASQAATDTVLLELNRKIGETCSLAALRGGEIVYIGSVASDAPLTLQFQAGHKAPLHCTSSGHLILSEMSKRQFDAYLESGPWHAYTRQTITDPARLTRIIKEVRAQGFAINQSTFVDGVMGIAVPIRDSKGRLLACLTVSAPSSRKSIADLTSHLSELRSAADRLSRVLSDVHPNAAG